MIELCLLLSKVNSGNTTSLLWKANELSLKSMIKCLEYKHTSLFLYSHSKAPLDYTTFSMKTPEYLSSS